MWGPAPHPKSALTSVGEIASYPLPFRTVEEAKVCPTVHRGRNVGSPGQLDVLA